MKTVIISDLSKWMYEQLVSLWNEAGLPFKPLGRDSFHSLSTRLETTPTWLILLVEDGVDENFGNGQPLIGAVIVTHDGQRGWINRLAIHPEHRGKGYARKLIKASEDFLRSHKIYLFAALIETENEPSLNLFKSEGFVVHENLLYLSKRDDENY